MRNTVKKITSGVLVLAMFISIMMSVGTIDANAAKKKSAGPTPAQYAAVFDATYYANKYPDLKAAFGTNETALFNHFYNSGMAEGRQGSEEFNVQAYMNRYPDLKSAFGNDLKKYYVHYVTSGKAEGRNGRASGSAAQAPAKTPASTTTVTPTNSYQDQVVALVNQDRAKNGLAPVSTTPQLNAAAQARANEIVSYFSHTRPDGRSCFTAFNEYGVVYYTGGENIAAGQQTPESVETCWMNSSGHRANILNGRFGHIGVGYVTAPGGYGTYWVQMFTN